MSNEVSQANADKKGAVNYFNFVGKLKCGISVYSGAHTGKYIQTNYFGNLKGDPNSLALLADGKALISIWPLMSSFTTMDSKDFNDKYMDAGRMFMKALDAMLPSIALSSDKSYTTGLYLTTNYSVMTVTFMNYKLYCDLGFIVDYLAKIVLLGGEDSGMHFMIRYLTSNLASWIEFIENNQSFFDANLSEFIAMLRSAAEVLGTPPSRGTHLFKPDEPAMKDLCSYKEPLMVSHEDLMNSPVGLFIGLVEASEKLGMSHTTLKKRGMAGEIQMYKHLTLDKFYFKPVHIDEYIKGKAAKFQEKVRSTREQAR